MEPEDQKPQAVGDLRPAITKQYSGKLQTEIEDLHLGNPVMRSYYVFALSPHR
jgi:hypothetical protein